MFTCLIFGRILNQNGTTKCLSVSLCQQSGLATAFLCHLRSIATHRDHFVRRLSVRLSVLPSVCPSVIHTLIAMFHRRHMHSSECCHYFFTVVFQQWTFKKIVAAFQGMHVSPAKHSYESVTDGRTDRQTDGQTDDGQSDPYVSLCFAGDTKTTVTDDNSFKLHIYKTVYTS